MPKKNSLKTPSEKELQSIAELFILARSGLSHWKSDDNILLNMGSISPKDIDDKGSGGREKLLEILAMANLPKLSIGDLSVDPDDLQIVLPAITSVLESFTLPGLKKDALKKFNEALDAAFGQVALNSQSAKVEKKVGDILSAIRVKQDTTAKKPNSLIKKSLKPSHLENINNPFAVPSATSQIIITSYVEGYDCIGWYMNTEHVRSIVNRYYFNTLYYSVEFEGKAGELATSENLAAALLRKEYSVIREKSEYAKCIPQRNVADFVKWLEESVVNKKHEYKGQIWNPNLDFLPDGIIGHG